MIKICLYCKKEFNALKQRNKFCSKGCHDSSRIGVKLPPRSKKWRENLSKALMGNRPTKATRMKMRLAKLGHKQSYEQIRKRIETFRRIGHVPPLHKGTNHPNWKGGEKRKRTALERLRLTKKYRDWKREVFWRDEAKCTMCGSTENPEVDHIKTFKDHPGLRFELSNGRTLCKKHHQETETWGN